MKVNLKSKRKEIAYKAKIYYDKTSAFQKMSWAKAINLPK